MATGDLKDKETIKQIGDFLVGKTLGAGSFSKVKLGTHIRTNKKVALKLIEHSKVQTEKEKTTIAREIKILKLLDHKNIVKMYDVIEMEETNTTCIILEYVEGGELFDYIVAKGKLSHTEAAKFLRQILSALEYCHSTFVIHRDLKPENLLLDSQKNIKINDFGLSNVMTTGKFLTTSCGSPHYSSPEILLRKKYIGPEVDVWSVGVILFAMVCGYLPWDGDELNVQLNNAVIAKYNIPSHVTEECVDLLKRMLQPDASKRATIEEIRKHPFVVKHGGELQSCLPEPLVFSSLDPEIVSSLKSLGFEEAEITKDVLSNVHTSRVYQLYSLVARDKMKKEEEKLLKEKPLSVETPLGDSSRPSTPTGGSRPTTPSNNSRPTTPNSSNRPSTPNFDEAKNKIFGIFNRKRGNSLATPQKEEVKKEEDLAPSVSTKKGNRLSLTIGRDQLQEILPTISEDENKFMKAAKVKNLVSAANANSTTTKPIAEVIAELERALEACGIEYKIKKKGLAFHCKEKKYGVKFDIEICRIENVERLKALDLKRKKGDTFDYKNVYTAFYEQLKL